MMSQVREENGHLGAQLVEAKMKSEEAQGEVAKLRKERAWLLEKIRTAETSILHLQTSGVDLSSKLEILQNEHKKALDELAFERDRVKVILRSVVKQAVHSVYTAMMSYRRTMPRRA